MTIKLFASVEDFGFREVREELIKSVLKLRGKKSSKKKGRKRKYHKRTRAKDFGDNPKIRHSYGEHKSKNKAEPWER